MIDNNKSKNNNLSTSVAVGKIKISPELDLRWFSIVLLITLTILLLLSPYDLKISLSFESFRKSFLGWLVQDWGKKPVIFFFVTGGAPCCSTNPIDNVFQLFPLLQPHS